MNRALLVGSAIACGGLVRQAGAEPLWHRAALEVVGTAGVYQVKLSELDDELVRHGYSTLPTTYPAYGLAIQAGYRPWRFALAFDGLFDRTARGPGTPLEISLVHVSMGAGYRLFMGDRTALVASVDPVLSDVHLDFDARYPPISAGDLQGAKQVRRSQVGLDLGVELEQVVSHWHKSRDRSAELGSKLTVRLGYLWQLGQEGPWWGSAGHGMHRLMGGPDLDVSGFYFRLGYGLAAGLDFSVRKP